MWPFPKRQASEVPEKVLQEAFDELGLVRLNQMQTAMEIAVRKQLDPANLFEEYYGGESGHFNPEFKLITTPDRMKSVYRQEPWVYTASSIIARTLATVPYYVKNKQTGEIDTTHPMNQILKTGNDIQDQLSMDWAGNLDLVLSGNYFSVLDGDQVLHVPVEYVTLNIAENESERRKYGPIISIDIQGALRAGSPYIKPQTVEWKDVIHFKLPNPFSPFIGFSMIAAAARPILLDRHKNEFDQAFYLRGGTNAGVIETTEDINKRRMERLISTYESAFTGRRNWFRQLFLPKGAKWVNSGLTMAEMQHLEGLRENRLTLLAVLGVPPMKVGIVQDVNRSTAEIQEKTFWENTIIPLAKMKAAGWNKSYLVRRKFKGEIEVVPNFDDIEAVEGGILTRAEQAKAVENIATINEQRKMIGLAPLKDTDPRGNMFTVELVRSAMPDPFGSALNPSEGLGPDDEPTGQVREVEVGPQDGDGPAHTHKAEIDDLGNGQTTTTDGDAEPHTHDILSGDVQAGGADGHTHPPIDMSDNEERAFGHLKKAVVDAQERVETSMGKRYLTAYDNHLGLKFDQVRKGLHNGVNDMRSYMLKLQGVRLNVYRSDTQPVLNDSMERGFAISQTNTRHFSFIAKKAYQFSPEDEMAIDAIRERTRDEKRKTLEQRAIEHFYGFDENETEQIVKLIEDGLKEGMTTEAIAKTIETRYGQNYRDQAFTIARTETLFAVSQGIQWQHETLKSVFSEVNKQWFHVGDWPRNPMAREAHFHFEKVGIKGVVPSDYVYVNEDTGGRMTYPRDPQAGPADTINCRCSLSSVIPQTAQSNARLILGE